MSGERTRRVGVIGGGVAGLAAARRLRARGDLDVRVWEAADRAGGVIATSVVDGFAREHAANGFLTGAPAGAAELAEELGLPVEPASAAAQRRWVFRGGRLRPIPSGPGDVLRAELLSWRGLLHALGEPFRPPRLSGPEETVADFARRRLGEEVLEALVAPLCTGVFAGDAEQLSLRAAFPKLAALEADGGLVRGSALRMLRRLVGQEGQGGPRPRLAAPQGGMGALVAALAREVGPALELGCPAVAVEVEAGGRARAVRLADGRREGCDVVVLATPAHAAARLVSDASRELAHVLDAIPYAGVAVVHLGYRRSQLAPRAVAPAAPGGPGPLDGFGFLVARGEELRILGAVFESVIWPGRAPADHVLIRCILGGARDPAALELDEEALALAAQRDLERALGLGAAPVHRHVVRWPRGIAQYTLGHLERVARAEELADGLGVVLAGSAYHGVAVNACAADAARVVHRVTARLGLVMAAVLAMSAVGLGGACSSGAVPGGAAAGQHVELELASAGLGRVASAADPESAAWVVVREQRRHVAVSDERGRVGGAGDPHGEASLWHPPVGEKRPPLTARAAIEVESGSGAGAVVSLARAPGPTAPR